MLVFVSVILIVSGLDLYNLEIIGFVLLLICNFLVLDVGFGVLGVLLDLLFLWFCVLFCRMYNVVLCISLFNVYCGSEMVDWSCII